jgi:bacterioferritin-associated ferredoxin
MRGSENALDQASPPWTTGIRCNDSAEATPRFVCNAIDNHSHLGLNQIMYVCICNAVTDKQIRKAAQAGVEDLWDLQRELGVAVGCGACKEMASEILRENRRHKTQFEPARYQPASG